MIIKKPYAFLIKNFRIIHLLLFCLLTYLFFKSINIFSFFNEYASSGYYTYYTNLASNFVNFYMFIAIILVLVFSSFIYFLFKWKKKTRVFYVILLLYYIVVFISFIVLFLTLNNIVSSPPNIREIRIIRDLVMILTFLQFIFIVFSLIRGLGFNIKSFEFSKDVEDLNIELKDNEEVEVILGKDSYKYFRKARKLLREIKYFILENKFIFMIIIVVFTLVLSLIFILNKEVYNKVYKEGETFNSSGLKIKIIESYKTNTDYKGNIINKDNYYIILKINVDNNTNDDIKINPDYFRLKFDNKLYYPIFGKGNYFLDLGVLYNREKISSSSTKEVLLIYEIENNIKNDIYRLNVFEKVNVLKGEINPTIKEITIKPKPLNVTGDIIKYNLSSSITFEKTYLNDSLFRIDSYLIGDTFTEKYDYCTSNKCYKGTNIVKSSRENSESNTLIKINSYYEVDNNSSFYKYVKTSKDFMKRFGSIEYTINGNKKTSTIKVLDSKNNNTMYLEVPQDLEIASSIDIIITIRNIIYSIKLK